MDIITHDILFSLITLTFLEIVLGIDNLIFIAIVVAKLPQAKRKNARMFGLGLAFIIRILMLMTLSWIMTLTEPLFKVGDFGLSFKNLLLIFGGIFLIAKSGLEISSDVWGGVKEVKETKEEKKLNASKNVITAIVQISMIDFVFSFDSVITAVGMTNNIPIIIIAIIISMIVMLLASEKISYFLHKYPSLKIVALAFIFMIGVILMVDGFHIKIPKGYLYFSLFFTLIVEFLNIWARKKRENRSRQ